MKRLTPLLLALLLLLGRLAARAQSVGIGTANPDASAALDVAATARGLLVPRLTQVQRAAIAAPAKGLLVFQTDGAQPGFWFNAGTAAAPAWTFLSPTGVGDNLGNHTATTALNLQGNALTGTGDVLGAAVVGLGIRADGGLNLGQGGVGHNVLLGFQAGQHLVPNGTTNQGSFNLMVGVQAGGETTTGRDNVFLGHQSGHSNTTGFRNLFSGYASGYSNTTGDQNQFSGYQSGYSNTTGGGNQFSGFQSGYSNTTGHDNLFSGYLSGQANTTGHDNLFSGYQSGQANTIGSGNQFSGSQSGLSNTTGDLNQFSGFQSGYSNTTGSGNQFDGNQSGYSNTTGSDNLFSGFQSGYYNTTGSDNLFSGVQSGYFNTTGSFNQFSGFRSGFSNTTGLANQFSGLQSGYNNTTGTQNQFSGYGSGFRNTTGNDNTAVGFQSGYFNTTGSENTALGINSGPAPGFTGLSNTLALGSAATVFANNTIQLGNSLITALRCRVGLTVTSDARFKYAVQADVPGLAFVTRLRPVTYRFDQAKLAAFERTGALPPGFGPPDPRAPLRSGFLAQDVEAAARALGYAFDGVHAPANARDYYGLDYAQFVVPLVQAVQELSQEVDALKYQNAALQARAERAEAATGAFEQRLRALEAGGARAQAASPR